MPSARHEKNIMLGKKNIKKVKWSECRAATKNDKVMPPKNFLGGRHIFDIFFLSFLALPNYFLVLCNNYSICEI